MKNILTGCRMRKFLFIAVCIRSSLWGEVCYSAETGRVWSDSDTGKEWVNSALQQNNSIKVTGIITSESGEPIIGATVQELPQELSQILTVVIQLRYLMEILFYQFHLSVINHKK